jgi:hypothetical protein
MQVRVVTATNLVTYTRGCGTALVAGAGEQALLSACVGRNLVGAAVSLPDIHLIAADAISGNVSLEKVNGCYTKMSGVLTTPSTQGVTKHYLRVSQRSTRY